MPSLHEVQYAMRRGLVDADDSMAASYFVAAGLASDQRLAIYRHTFESNVARALRLTYPVVQRLVGVEFFEVAARIFMHEHPPRTADLDAYGTEFPTFLAGFAPASSVPYVADVARLECAVNRALHARDAEPLEANQLAGIDPSNHDRIQFVVAPSITLLTVDYPVDAIWRGVLAEDDASLATIDLTASPVQLLIERGSNGVEVKRVDASAWQFSKLLFDGEPLGTAVAVARTSAAPAMLAEHFTAGRFIAYRVARLPARQSSEIDS